MNSPSKRSQTFPIRSELKSKRIKFDTPQNTLSWAYMKELRENNRTRRIYDCDPYVEVYRFRDNLYGLFSENCDGMGDVWMYLIVGPEKALLIDTAFGLGDTKALVDELAGGRELIVVNTHDHYDHAYGNCRFGRVYCHENLVPLLQNQNEHMWDYLFDDYGDNIWLEFDREDLPRFAPYEIIGVPDGYTWDLGDGYEVELINCNGHGGDGAAMYLDKRGRILFPGDNICSDVSGCGSISYPIERSSMGKYREALRRIVDRIGEYDYIFPQHFMNDIENSLMPNVLEAVEAICSNPYDYDYNKETWGKLRGQKRTRYFKFIKGFSVIGYGIET